jgi:hypothetical protein
MCVEELLRLPKILTMPKQDEHRNSRHNESARDLRPKTPTAEIVYFPNTPDRQKELWLKLADSALNRRTARRKRLLQ